MLTAVFDECDRYGHVETGGRIVGTYRRGRNLDVTVTGMIDAGPQARRAVTSFFQDGEYQEGVFREIEREHPDIEHLGTWHTHHVNGFPTLSGGDIETYRRTVNHPQHNLDFWYALLVTAKVAGPDRYRVKHYLLRRHDDKVYKIPPKLVRVAEERAIWVPGVTRGRPQAAPASSIESDSASHSRQERRAFDDQVLRQLFPNLRPFFSEAAQCLLWKGSISLLDHSSADVVVVESVSEGKTGYEAMVPRKERERFPVAARAQDETPWLAVRRLELHLNRLVAGLGN
ncbi:MAG: hypothetical protein HY337_09880 [Gemmatimonadetes bacterium]|nr:hypothetical protein [Gemmatimonadota bacterium]